MAKRKVSSKRKAPKEKERKTDYSKTDYSKTVYSVIKDDTVTICGINGCPVCDPPNKAKLPAWQAVQFRGAGKSLQTRASFAAPTGEPRITVKMPDKNTARKLTALTMARARLKDEGTFWVNYYRNMMRNFDSSNVPKLHKGGLYQAGAKDNRGPGDITKPAPVKGNTGGNTSFTFYAYGITANTYAFYPSDPCIKWFDKGTEELGPKKIPFYPFMKLAGESGELLQKMAKIIRDQGGSLYTEEGTSSKEIVDLIKELGDILWYVNACAQALGVDLAEVANRNLAKLTMRRLNGTLGGSGDDR